MWTDRSDCFKIFEMCFDDMYDIDIIQNLDIIFLGSVEQVRGECLLVNNNFVDDVLTTIKHARGLQTIFVQPAHVENQ